MISFRAAVLLAAISVVAVLEASASLVRSSKIVEICEKPPVSGNEFCRAELQRWSFNSEDEKCVQIEGFYGCSQTENNFASEADCLKTCGGYKNEAGKRKKTYPDACWLPGGQCGKCSASFRRFFFDSKSGICKIYIFGGCNESKNSFGSAQECEKYCPVVGSSITNLV